MKLGFAYWTAIFVLAVLSLFLLLFCSMGLAGALRGDGLLGEFFVLLIRQEGGLVELAEHLLAPVMAFVAVKVEFPTGSGAAQLWLRVLLGLSGLMIVAFFFILQLNAVADEIWVRDTTETFASQADFQEAIRSFTYVIGGAVIAYGLILFGLRKRENGELP